MTKIKKGNDDVGKVQEKKETEADQSSRMIIMYEFVLSCIDEDQTIQTLYAQGKFHDPFAPPLTNVSFYCRLDQLGVHELLGGLQ